MYYLAKIGMDEFYYGFNLTKIEMARKLLWNNRETCTDGDGIRTDLCCKNDGKRLDFTLFTQHKPHKKNNEKRSWQNKYAKRIIVNFKHENDG